MSQNNKSPLGCFYAIWLGIACTVLLIVNFEAVRALLDISGLRAINTKAAQVLQFFTPIVLIVIEFWLYDAISDRAEYHSDLEAPLDRKP